MNDIGSHNFQALREFNMNIANPVVHNSEIKIVNVKVIYDCNNSIKEVETKCHVLMNNQPFAKIAFEDSKWLNSNDYYCEFQSGYNSFFYDKLKKILIIKSNQNSKLGSYYEVRISEL